MNEVIEYKGYTISISPDDTPSDPIKEFDMFCDFYCWHGRYNLGGEKPEGVETPEDMDKWLTRKENAGVWTYLWMMDHGSLYIASSTPQFRAQDPQGWDWGKIGVAYISYEKIKREFGIKRMSERVAALAREQIEGSISVYNQYLNGEVYYYVITDSKGEEVDSLSDIFGYDDTLQQAKNMVDLEVGDV